MKFLNLGAEREQVHILIEKRRFWGNGGFHEYTGT